MNINRRWLKRIGVLCLLAFTPQIAGGSHPADVAQERPVTQADDNHEQP